MKLLYDGLPCTSNFMRLKQEYYKSKGLDSPKVKKIASPILLNKLPEQPLGLNFKPLKFNLSLCDSSEGEPGMARIGHPTQKRSPDVRVKNLASPNHALEKSR